MKKFLVICALLMVTPVFANVYYFDGNGNSSFKEGQEAYTDYDHVKIEKIEKNNGKKVESKKSTTSSSSSTTKSNKKKKKKKKLKAV